MSTSTENPTPENKGTDTTPAFLQPGVSSKPRRLRLGRWIVGATFLATVYAWTIGPYGLVRQWNWARDVRAQEIANDSLRARNHRMSDSLRLFATDSATIASEARRQGLVQPGEISVRFVDTTQTP
jgi:cell division protein FtsB